MTQPFSKTDQNDPHPDSIEGMFQFGLNVTYFLASVMAAPVEMALRRKQGSRYQPLVVLALAPLPPLLFGLAQLSGSYLGLGDGLVGIWKVYTAVQIVFWLHVIHVANVMIHPEKEAHSRDDGTQLPFWKSLPRGDKWAMVRFVYEPGLVLGLGLLGPLFHLLSPAAGIYLVCAAFALAIKVTFIWYKAWEWLRDMLDQLDFVRTLSGQAREGGMDAVKAAMQRAMLRVPVTVPPAARTAFEDHARKSLPAEIQSMIDEAKATEPLTEQTAKRDEEAVAAMLSESKETA